MTLQELNDVALKWNLKIQQSTLNKVMELIYNDQNSRIIQMNQGNNDRKPNKFHCYENNPSQCTLMNCELHPIKQSKLNASLKTYPTNFGRAYPICWLIAGVQFLAPIEDRLCYKTNHFYLFTKTSLVEREEMA